MEIEEQTCWLADAVNTTMNPEIDQASRMKAYQICEDFKETSPNCVACGALLTDASKYTSVIRHFGLQLLEHFVRFKWNDATVEQKVEFKNLTLEMITKRSTNVLDEESYIKEGTVKIIVEMIKREWPQQWPSLLEELDQMCQIGESQTELVLLILLRLVEDVVSFHNVQQARRRKDLWQALLSNMAQISSFLFKVVEMYSEKYQALANSAPQDNETKSALKIAQTALLTLCGFVDWMDAKHLFKDDKNLLIILYKLLGNEELKMLGAECLQLIVHRKGKIEERKPLMVLFCDVAMTELFNAAVKACSAGLDEKNHLFLKKLCQVITGLGTQLCVIWTAEKEAFVPPANLASYLKTLFSFTQHASTHVCHLTSASWMAFLKHEYMSKTQVVLDMLPSLCQTFTHTSQKLGFPSRNDSPACTYARIDFDSDEEFVLFFASHRYNQLEILRFATGLCPETTFSIAAHWLQDLLAAPLEREEGKELCTLHSGSTVKWDAMSSYLDVVITTLIKKDQLPTQQAVELLQATLNSKIEDPMILSYQLTCISTLFPVLHHSKQHVESVLDKLFAAAVYSLPGLTKKTRTRSVQNVRRHACSAMVKMCRDHQNLMLPHFEKIYTHVQMLIADPEQLTQLERVTLSEALILLNNGLHDWTRQSALIAEIMQPVTDLWLSSQISEMIQSAESLIHHIGLDHPSNAEASLEEAHNKNRAQIFSCISTAQAVIKRSCWPADPQVAEAGGFISGHSPNGAPIYKNPCTPHILPMLPNLFTLARTLNAMWSPECRAKVCPEYRRSYSMTDNERNTILGLLGNSTEIPVNKPVVEKVQIFLTVVYETTCHLFADCFQSLGYEFYAAEGLSTQLLESIFTNLHHLPDYRLRHIIRVVAKTFVQLCPKECWESALIPLMTGLTSYMVNRLNQQWAVIILRTDASNDKEDQSEEQETQEVVEDHLIRVVTKDFMELLGSLCWNNSSRNSPANAAVKEEGGGVGGADNEMETEEAMEQGDSGGGNDRRGEPLILSDLGKVILQNERLCESMVTCVYTAMSWPDSGVCMKACRLSWLVVQELATRPLLPDAVTHLYTSILKALQVHGDHDTCRTELVFRAMQHYELLREKYPVLTEVMLSLPNCTQAALQKFHEKVPCSKPSERKKRDAFKSFIQGFIAEHVSQKFKRTEVIHDLPAIYKPMKPKKPSIIDSSVAPEDVGLIMLFASDTDL